MEHALTRIDPDAPGRPGVAHLVLRGDVDACDQPALERLRSRLTHAAAVHVDVGEVGFCGTTFLGFLAQLAQQAREAGGALHLLHVSCRIVALLMRAGMDAQFDWGAVGDGATLRLRREVPAPSESTRP